LSHQSQIVISGGARTPIGRFGGALSGLTAAEMGGVAAAAALTRTKIAAGDVDELIFGNARQAGGGPNVARQIARRAGLPPEVPAYTVNRACGSGLQAIVSAAQAIRAGDARIVIAGGTESMSRLPHFVGEARFGHPEGDIPIEDGMYRDGFLCPLCGQLMGDTAETLADRYHIPREEQDAYAAASQNRCEAARRAGKFDAEIVPVQAPGGHGGSAITVSADEHPRDGVTTESMAKLPAVFRKGGTVHAGNSSGITDGAAAVVVMEASEARRRGVTPVYRLAGHSVAGVEAAIMGIGPVPALRKLSEKTGVSPSDVDLIELNEAFAAQVLACQRDLHLDPERVNVNGGAIALGHPIGATGARIVVTLLHEMHRRGSRRGIATLCISGGMGMAALFEAAPA
jgi:acetyl-CoA C-acetyltransferase